MASGTKVGAPAHKVGPSLGVAELSGASIHFFEIRAFVEAHFLMDASATLLSLALTPLVLAVEM